MAEYPFLTDCSEEDRKDAWSTFFDKDPCYTTTLLFARESKVVDFYGIFARAGLRQRSSRSSSAEPSLLFARCARSTVSRTRDISWSFCRTREDSSARIASTIGT
jgi:hypothetical protein